MMRHAISLRQTYGAGNKHKTVTLQCISLISNELWVTINGQIDEISLSMWKSLGGDNT